jgi:hypothetical protein
MKPYKRFILSLLAALALVAQTPDPRNIKSGMVIPGEGYSDQPYVVKTGDGAWLCAIPTAASLPHMRAATASESSDS